MTKTRNRFVALLAAALLAFGLGFMVATPQKAHAAETKLAAGTSFALARDITPKTGGTVAKKKQAGITKGDFVVTQRNLATFNTDNDNHYYKFTTSSRNSRYRITVCKEASDGRAMNIEIRNSKLQRFSTAATDKTKLQYQTTFDTSAGAMDRNSTYYIELSRYAPDSQTSGSADRSPYVDYRITIEEIVPKPEALDASDWTFKLYTKSKKYTYNVTRRSFYADGYQVQHYIPRLGNWYTVNFSGTTVTFNNAQVKKSIEMGSKYGSSYWKYLARIRPYRVVNGIKFYGDWCKAYSKSDKGTYVKVKKTIKNAYLEKSNGAYVKCKAKLFGQADDGKYAQCKKSFSATLDGKKVKFVKDKYYKIGKNKLETLSKKDQKKYFKYSGGLVRYSVQYKKGAWVKYNEISGLSNTEKRAHFTYSDGKIVRYKYVTSKYKKNTYIPYSVAIKLHSASSTNTIYDHFVRTSTSALQRYANAKAVTIVHS